MGGKINIPEEAKPFMCWSYYGQMNCHQVVVYLVVRANPNVSTGAVATAIKVSKPSITRAIDKLEKMGLVTRRTDQYDRRKVNLKALDVKRVGQIRQLQEKHHVPE